MRTSPGWRPPTPSNLKCQSSARPELLAAQQDRLMLRTARHMHDFASLEADPPANAEQEIGVVGNRRFRLGFGFNLRVTVLR